MDQQTPKQRARGWMAAMAALALVAAPAVASAQATTSSKSGPTSASMSTKISTSVTVQAIDVSSRHIMVKLPSGDTTSLKVSPDFKRLGDLKPGDKIKATYYQEVAYSLAEAGKPLPEDSDSVLAARAVNGEPGAVVASRATVTGAVLGIDIPGSRVKVVNPNGGEVHDVAVTTPEGKAFLSKLKVGDKVTARVQEALLISVDR